MNTDNIAACPNPECGWACNVLHTAKEIKRVYCSNDFVCGYSGPRASTEAEAIRLHNLICGRPESSRGPELQQIEELAGIALGTLVKGPDEDGDHWCSMCDAMLEDEMSGHKATCASRVLRDIFDIASRPHPSPDAPTDRAAEAVGELRIHEGRVSFHTLVPIEKLVAGPLYASPGDATLRERIEKLLQELEAENDELGMDRALARFADKITSLMESHKGP